MLITSGLCIANQINWKVDHLFKNRAGLRYSCYLITCAVVVSYIRLTFKRNHNFTINLIYQISKLWCNQIESENNKITQNHECENFKILGKYVLQNNFGIFQSIWETFKEYFEIFVTFLYEAANRKPVYLLSIKS